MARGGTFLEREFLAEEIHGKEIELDECQPTNEASNAQAHEMEIEQPYLDDLRFAQSLPS